MSNFNLLIDAAAQHAQTLHGLAKAWEGQAKEEARVAQAESLAKIATQTRDEARAIQTAISEAIVEHKTTREALRNLRTELASLQSSFTDLSKAADTEN